MRIGILTGGGDVSSLNAIIYGALETVKERGGELIGFKRGWSGVMGSTDFIPIENVDPKQGGTLLRSSRTKLKGEMISQAAYNIDHMVDRLIAIGGDDTLTVGKQLSAEANIPVCLVSKTIDNDVGTNAHEGELNYDAIINYFTPGFPTAAEKAAQFAADLKTTSYSHERVMFLETMGRSPGWLALSSYVGKPDFILIPEVGLNFSDFAYKLDVRYKEQGYAVVVVSEGVRYEGCANPIAQDESVVDPHGHAKLGGAAELLAARVKEELGIENSNYTNPNYLYRSGPPNELDLKMGISLGRLAAHSVQNGLNGNVAVVEREGDSLITKTRTIDKVLSTDSEGLVIPRRVDSRFYDQASYQITEAGKEYFRLIHFN